MLGCGSGNTEEPGASPPLRISWVSLRPKSRALFGEPDAARATLSVTNVSTDVLAFWGVNGIEPVTRLAVRDGERWVEGEPSWIECGTGLYVGALGPGQTAMVEVYIPMAEKEYRVGVGCWPALSEEAPPWSSWSWAWSESMLVGASTYTNEKG